MKLMLKAPESKRLNFKYEEPPSNLDFNSNLSRYIKAVTLIIMNALRMAAVNTVGKAGLIRLDTSSTAV